MASPPSELNGFGVDRPHLSPGGHALHTGPYPPDWSRLRGYGASNTGSHMLHLLTSPNGPAPSGSSGTSRFRRGRLPPSPAFPRIRLPPGFNQAAATTQREGLSPSSINQAPRGAQLRPERRMPTSISRWPAST